MKLRTKVFATALAVTLCAGLTTPAFATGYAAGPWTGPGLFIPDGSGYSNPAINNSGGRGRTGGSSYTPPARSNASGGTTTGTTSIADSPTPTTSAPTVGLQNNNGAKPATAGSITTSGTVKRMLNVSTVSPEAVSGVSGIVNCDVVVGGTVAGRVYLDATALKKAGRSVDVSMSFDAKDTSYATGKFSKNFSGNFKAVKLAEQGVLPFPWTIAIHKSQLTGVDLSKLVVLIYNQTANSYSKVPATNVEVKDDYVYITLTKGGTLIFTDSSSF